MTEQNSSYRSIFKATTLFGGVQIITIIVSLIKGKFVAVLLGATGMGITALLLNPLNIIITIAGMGLSTSAIKNISQTYSQGDKLIVSRIIFIFRKCLIICCIFGTLILVLTSPLLSQFSFRNSNYTYSFMILALMLIPSILYQGNQTILQGTRNLKSTAKLSLWGSLVGILTAIPIYYIWGIKGIVPAIIIPVWFAYGVSVYFTKKISLPRVVVPKKEVISVGLDMAKLGFVLVISILFGQLSTYILNAYISKTGNIADVGYMGAAITMTTQAVTLVFSAMSADYYPRLSAVCNDRTQMNSTVNQQGEILMLITLPILICFSIFSPLIINVLLSNEFQIINGFIRIIAFGMIFKTASYAIGYISFSKGDRKTFFLMEAVWGNFFNLVLNIVGYIFWGLDGLAISFAINYVVYFIIVVVVTHYKYGYHFSKEYGKILIIASTFALIMLLLALFAKPNVIYVAGCLLLMIVCIFSYKELDKRIGIGNLIHNVQKKLK